jgi:hypothetical protein
MKQLKIGPRYEILIPVMVLYTIVLFAPTFDINAVYKLNIFNIHLIFTVPSFYFPLIYPLADSITEV